MDTLPRDIHIGMTVYDSRRKHIGKVDDLKFPENEDTPEIVPADIDGSDRRSHESLLDNIAQAFAADEIPEVLRERLLREGYLRLDADGLFASDRYILPSQIASAAGDEVVLNVEKDALIKRH